MLTKKTLVNTDVHHFIQYIHQLLHQEAFADSVLSNLIDSETITLLGYVFAIYGTVVFDLTFYNEVTKSDNILKKY